MATTDPRTVTPAKPAPAPPAEDEADEAPAPAPAPIVEVVSFAGCVLEKTTHPDGYCETTILREPEIEQVLVDATSKYQRSRGH